IENGGFIPASIADLTKKGLKIFIKDENLFSYKKIVYALKENPEKTIITADDDVIYPDSLLHRLIQKSQEYPKHIVCFRGHFLSFDKQEKLLPYRKILDRRLDNAKRTAPSFCLLPTGVSGVLYPPHSLDEIATDQEQFMSLSPYADDIWLKIASLKKGTLCVQAEKRNLLFPSIPKTQEVSLASINVERRENDRQIQACFAKYPDLLEKVKQDARRLNMICKVSVTMKILDCIHMIRCKLNLRLRHRISKLYGIIFHAR
ncbi:MAG: hypothetical protein LBR71_00505, partial [Synergistaceae bacterium]|nr:hypothetical protein [Synergistaceae bacterium]